MARPINAGFTPAQIIQQYQYYQYPIQQLITAYGAKEEQQQKAIDSLDTYDSELGKYTALPGEVEKRDAVIKQYNTLKDITADQDLTGRTGRKAITEFKSKLTGDIFPKLTAYDASAKAFKENYKQEQKKITEGKGNPVTLMVLDDMAKNWDSDQKGIFTGVTRGEYMDLAKYAKEFQPEILKGGWAPPALSAFEVIYNTGYDKLLQRVDTKTITEKDVTALYNNWVQYLGSAGYMDDFSYVTKLQFTPEEALQAFDKTIESSTNSQFNLATQIAKGMSTTDEDNVRELAGQLGVSTGYVKELITKTKNKRDVQELKFQLLESRRAKALTVPDEAKVNDGYKALTNSYLSRQLDPMLQAYAGKITDISIKTANMDDWLLKEKIRAANDMAIAQQANYTDEGPTFGLAETSMSGQQAANYYSTTALDSVDKWANALANIAELDAAGRTDSEAVALKNQNQRIANSAQSDLNILYNINNVTHLSADSAKKLFNKLATVIGYKDSQSSAGWQQAAGSLERTISQGKNVSLKTVLNQFASLYRVPGVNKANLKQTLKDNFFKPDVTGISLPNTGLTVASSGVQILGKTKDDFLKNVRYVFDGNQQVPMTEEMRKRAGLTTDGRVEITDSDGGSKIYNLTNADNTNLQAVVEQKVAVDKERSRSSRQQERTSQADLQLRYPTIYSSVTNVVSGITNVPEAQLATSGGVQLILRKNSAAGSTYYTLIEKQGNNETKVTDNIFGDAYSVMRAVDAYMQSSEQ